MGVLRFVSRLALVSLAINSASFEMVEAAKHHKPTTTIAVNAPPAAPPAAQTPAVQNPKPVTTKAANTITTSSSTTSPGPAVATVSIESNTTGVTNLGAYSLVKNYAGSSFFDQFNFFSGSDPTHGFVEYIPFFVSSDSSYVDAATAQSCNMTFSNNGIAYVYPDFTNIAPGGRKSVRLESKDSFTEVLIIADFTHIPQAYNPI